MAHKLATKTDTSDIKGAPPPLPPLPPVPQSLSHTPNQLSSSDGVVNPPRSGSPNLVAARAPPGMPNFAAQVPYSS